MQREGGWNILCKFFDNMGPIPHHMHQSEEQAKLVGRRGKPEAYYFPPQYNQTSTTFRTRSWASSPGRRRPTCAGVSSAGAAATTGFSTCRARFGWSPGSGWQINPGILHAPGSLVTYEPQVNSDVFAMFQSEVEGRIVPWDLMIKDVPKEHHHDLDFLVDLLDWDANVNPEFAKSNRVFPCPVTPFAETEGDGYREQWVCYGTGHYSAKELTVLPKRAVTIRDREAYGLILTQGHGTFGKLTVSTPSMIRYGQSTEDELFVTATAAQTGVRVEKTSETDPLVILKHFGPGQSGRRTVAARGNR